MREEIQMTEKQPKRESAATAARRGKKLMQPLTTFAIWAASMRSMLNSLIRKTIRLADQPPAATVSPNRVAAHHSQ